MVHFYSGVKLFRMARKRFEYLEKEKCRFFQESGFEYDETTDKMIRLYQGGKRDLIPREFSFSFSNFENFQEREQHLDLRIDESNPRDYSRFENENEGNNFENSQGFS